MKSKSTTSFVTSADVPTFGSGRASRRSRKQVRLIPIGGRLIASAGISMMPGCGGIICITGLIACGSLYLFLPTVSDIAWSYASDLLVPESLQSVLKVGDAFAD
ncbi:hypothetical protein [Rhodopirellula europaea]|nr:hypothetical protein [Rhodopirellula europaea]